MSKLSVTEKEHWKQRVERRIDKAIEELSLKHPEFMPKLKQKARSQALSSLKIDMLIKQSDSIEAKTKLLKAEQNELENQIYQLSTGNTSLPSYAYSLRQNSEKAIAKHQQVIEDQLLTATATGKKFLKLRHEREELLDLIWLATSTRQIKELWSHVAELLGEESTQLQAQILEEQP